VNRNVADSNGGREASEGSLRTSRKVFGGDSGCGARISGWFLGGKGDFFWVFREEAGDRVFFLERKWLKGRVFDEH